MRRQRSRSIWFWLLVVVVVIVLLGLLFGGYRKGQKVGEPAQVTTSQLA